MVWLERYIGLQSITGAWHILALSPTFSESNTPSPTPCSCLYDAGRLKAKPNVRVKKISMSSKVNAHKIYEAFLFYLQEIHWAFITTGISWHEKQAVLGMGLGGTVLIFTSALSTVPLPAITHFTGRLFHLTTFIGQRWKCVLSHENGQRIVWQFTQLLLFCTTLSSPIRTFGRSRMDFNLHFTSVGYPVQQCLAYFGIFFVQCKIQF